MCIITLKTGYAILGACHVYRNTTRDGRRFGGTVIYPYWTSVQCTTSSDGQVVLIYKHTIYSAISRTQCVCLSRDERHAIKMGCECTFHSGIIQLDCLRTGCICYSTRDIGARDGLVIRCPLSSSQFKG